MRCIEGVNLAGLPVMRLDGANWEVAARAAQYGPGFASCRHRRARPTRARPRLAPNNDRCHVFRKLLAALGVGAGAAPAKATAYAPYASQAANDVHDLLFCDDEVAFAARPGQEAVPWQTTLAAKPPDIAALRALADEASQEGRVRYFAYRRLRGAQVSVQPKQLLAVIVEVALEGGLDTLAAYSEGGVRYINQTGKLAFFEGVAALQPRWSPGCSPPPGRWWRPSGPGTGRGAGCWRRDTCA